MALNRNKLTLGTNTTKPSVAWENEIINGVNTLLNNAIEVDFTKDFIQGFIFNYGTNTKTVTITSGVCLDSTTFQTIQTEKDYTLNIPASLDTGSLAANTWYYVWVIKNEISNIVSFITSLSDTNPKLPGNNYSSKRLIGAVYTTSSSGDIRQYSQRGSGNQRDFIQWDQSDALVTTTFTNNVYSSLSMSSYIPNSVYSRVGHIRGILRHTVAGTQGESTLALRHGDSTDTVGTYEGILKGYTNSAGRIFGDVCIGGVLKTNTSAQIGYAVKNDGTAGTKEITIVSLGFRMNL